MISSPFSDGIHKFMASKAGPDSKLLETVADCEKFLDRKDYAVVGKVIHSLHKATHNA